MGQEQVSWTIWWVEFYERGARGRFVNRLCTEFCCSPFFRRGSLFPSLTPFRWPPQKRQCKYWQRHKASMRCQENGRWCDLLAQVPQTYLHRWSVPLTLGWQRYYFSLAYGLTWLRCNMPTMMMTTLKDKSEQWLAPSSA